MANDKILEVESGGLGATSMRYHELWLQQWLYTRFFVKEGYPVPVVFGTPMDALGHFQQLWSAEQNPFRYLLDLKDAAGTPLYEPHPAPVRYPLISVMRKGIRYRPSQNFSIHSWRHINWPTVSSAGSAVPGVDHQGTNLVKCDLGSVTTSRMPMAFDYHFQIDHYCMRPDTQAFYVERLLNQFWRTGGTLQTWLEVVYPGWGSQYVRLFVDGDIDQSAPDDGQTQDRHVEFKTTFTITIEGFSVDVNYEVKPTLWKLVQGTAALDDLAAFTGVRAVTDLRFTGQNPVLNSRTDIPPVGACQVEGARAAYVDAGTAYLQVGDHTVPSNPGDNVVTSAFTPPALAPGSITVGSAFDYGIASTLQMGSVVFSGTA